VISSRRKSCRSTISRNRSTRTSPAHAERGNGTSAAEVKRFDGKLIFAKRSQILNPEEPSNSQKQNALLLPDRDRSVAQRRSLSVVIAALLTRAMPAR